VSAQLELKKEKSVILLSRSSATIAIACVCLWTPIALAQSEKVTLKMVPEPNQTVRLKMVQEMEMEMSPDGNATGENAMAGSMKMTAKTVIALSQKIGAQDKQGNYVSEMSYDEISSEITMNGQSMPIGDTSDKFKGKKILAIFNQQGTLTDLKIPPDLGLPEESLKQLMKSVYGNLPQTPIGIGETATSPLDFTVPIPVPGMAPLKLDGLMKFKLISIEKNASGRVAKFDQAVDGNMSADLEIPTPEGNVKMSVDFKMNGTGAIAMNIDKGFVQSGDSKATFGGKIKMTNDASETKLPGANLQGTLKVTITGGN
jgi:hypothetical protein